MVFAALAGDGFLESDAVGRLAWREGRMGRKSGCCWQTTSLVRHTLTSRLLRLLRLSVYIKGTDKLPTSCMIRR